MKKENIWGAINIPATDVTPLSYLKEQANLLSETTRNVFKASISTSTQKFDYNESYKVEIDMFSNNLSATKLTLTPENTNIYSSIVKDNLPKREPEYFHHSFRILVPKLDYSFILLTLTHDTLSLRPYQVYSHLEEVLRKGSSIEDLEKILNDIIKDPSVTRSLDNLIIQAR